MEKQKWISVKEGLPKDSENEKMFVFVQFHKNSTIVSYAGLWREIKIWRRYELQDSDNGYTHYFQLPDNPNHI